jgi:hypothetical protein
MTEEIRLMSEAGKAVEQRVTRRDSLSDFVDTKIRGKLNGVLHCNHRRVLSPTEKIPIPTNTAGNIKE